MNAVPSYLLRCLSCGTKNRIPVEKMREKAKCGKCGSPINTLDLLTGETIAVGDNDFTEKVVNSPLPVLLDCWAPWCGPCKMVGPIMEDLASEWKGRAKVCKLNVDENPRVANQFQIRSIPTLLIFDNGKLRETLVGALPKQQISHAMAPYI